LPVSSLGHGVILPSLLGWNIDQDSPTFLPFFVVLHLGTAAALLVFFRREWVSVIRGFFRTLATRKLAGDPEGRLAWLILAGTLPAGLVGLLFEKALSANFARPALAASFLILNGVILLIGERLRRRRAKRGASELSLWQAVAVGTSQVLALIPGISRSGVTVVGGLASGAEKALGEMGVAAADIVSVAVPGSFELPLAAQAAAESGRFDAIVALGAVIRGETDHYEHICREVASGLATVARESGVPVGFGVLTVPNEALALARAAAGPENKGAEAARAAVAMVDVLRKLKA